MLKLESPFVWVLICVAVVIFLLNTIGLWGIIFLGIGYYLYHTIFIYHGTLTKWMFIGIATAFIFSFSQFLATSAFVGCTLYGGYLRLKEVMKE